MAKHIAVFDVGKTNKKLLIFDGSLKIIDSATEKFSEYIENNIRFERIEEIRAWFFKQLKAFSQSYDIGSVSVTTQGATFVCINAEGDLAVPLVAYTTEPEEAFHTRFYSRFGSPNRLQEETATASMGSLVNPGKNIFFLQEQYPKDFAKTRWIINYPQYFGYLLTGSAGAEPTYVGCHSFLWEHRKSAWSRVSRELGIIDKLPDTISRSWDVLGTVTPEAAEKTGLSEDTLVTLGVHDSNASLLPYLIKNENEFVLNSSGTWCVFMHPAKDFTFAEDEIGKMIFYNLDVYGRPVKTSILMGGLEFERWSELMKNCCKAEGFPEFDPRVYAGVITEKRLFIMPGVQKGTGQFPESEPRVYEDGVEYHLHDLEKGKIPAFFKDFKTAYAVLNLSLAIQSKVALERTGMEDGMSIYTEGGFRNNPDYNTLLAAMFPGSRVCLTSLKEATAFGAALLGIAALERKMPEDFGGLFTIDTEEVKRIDFDGLDEYTKEFLELL